MNIPDFGHAKVRDFFYPTGGAHKPPDAKIHPAPVITVIATARTDAYFCKRPNQAIMAASPLESPYTPQLTWLLAALRIAIGWHFLYEGVVKLWNPGWSAGSYLMDSQGPLAWLFQLMTKNAAVLSIVDFLNIWALLLVGLGLMLGAFTRLAAIGGIFLLAFYYLSHPALIGVQYAMPTEGSYLLVNKNLIELLAIAVLYAFPTGHLLGVDRLLYRHVQMPVLQQWMDRPL